MDMQKKSFSARQMRRRRCAPAAAVLALGMCAIGTGPLSGLSVDTAHGIIVAPPGGVLPNVDSVSPDKITAGGVDDVEMSLTASLPTLPDASQDVRLFFDTVGLAATFEVSGNEATTFTATVPATAFATPGTRKIYAAICDDDDQCRPITQTAEIDVVPAPVTPPPVTPPAPPAPPVPEPVVPVVPEGTPIITETSTGLAIPGEMFSIAGRNFGARQGRGSLQIDDAAAAAEGWTDGRIDLRIPEDLEAGAAELILTTAVGSVAAPITVGALPIAPPEGNPVLVYEGGADFTFDASTAIDPATRTGVPGPNRAAVAGLSGIVDILWGFDDDTPNVQGVGTTRSYTRPGTFTPTVTVTSGDGRRSVRPAGTVRVVRNPRGRLVVATPPPVNFTVPGRVVFDSGRSVLRPESRSYLLRLASLVRRVGRRTDVGGHTDNTGIFAVSQKLSLARARAVRTFLVKEGNVPEGLLTATGYADTRPIDTNNTALGRQRNRRVELRIPRGGSDIRLTARQLKINQRISQVAVARATALEKRISQGLTSRDIRNGSISPQDFGASVEVTGDPSLDVPPADRPERVRAEKPKRSSVRLDVTAAQLRTNQRISQGALRRISRLESVIAAGLTGAAIRDGALAREDLAPGIAVTGPRVTTSGRFRLPKLAPRAAKKSGVRATQEQLIINQRVSQSAIRRLNILTAHVEKGFTGADFQDGSLTANDLAR